LKTFAVITLLAGGTLCLLSGDTLSDAIDKTTIKASLRYYTLQRSYQELVEDDAGNFTVPHKYQKLSNAMGGFVGFESNLLENLSIGSTLYTSQPLFHNPLNEGGLQLLEDDQSGYSVLGEAFVKLEYEKTMLKVGRQLLSDYGFLSDLDIRMTPYTYEAAILENRDLEHITLRMAAVRGVKTLVSTTYVDFVNASKNLLIEEPVERNPIRGAYNPAYYDGDRNYIGPKENLYLVSLAYHSKEIDFEFWDYYSANFVNFIYATGSYAFQMADLTNTLGLQLVKQDNVGAQVAGSIDTYVYGAKLTSIYDNFTFTYTFNRVKYDENSLDGGTIIDMWGGSQIYNSIMYNGGDQGGTTSQMVTVKYDFLLYGVTIQLNAGKFDLPNKLTDAFAEMDNKEVDLIAIYQPDWNRKLQFKIEAAYIDFDTDYDFRTYEDIHGFNILHAYEDILDLRFIVNYTF